MGSPKNKTSLYGLRYAEFVVPLLKAVQEQQVMIEEQRAENLSQQAQIDTLRQQLDELTKLFTSKE